MSGYSEEHYSLGPLGSLVYRRSGELEDNYTSILPALVQHRVW